MIEMSRPNRKGRGGVGVRSRNNSRERVSLLGNSSNHRGASQGRASLRGVENKRRTKNRRKAYDSDDADEERVSLMDGGTLSSLQPTNLRNELIRRLRSESKTWTTSRLMKYLVLLMISAIITFLMLRKSSKMIQWREHQNILEPEGSKETRCFEETRSSISERCSCPDPNKALRNDATKLWKSNHDHIVHLAKNAPADLDIVFLGDDTIEQLSGTRNLGGEMVEGMEEYFDRTFKKKNGGKFNGLALGSSGDTGPNLLWHWENGIKQSDLRPKLWFIMVGGNDLFVNKCTDRFVMANVLNLAKRIFEDRPESTIVIHGIIPRKDNPDAKSDALGHLWNRAQGVNLEVRKFVKSHSSRIFFMNLGQTLTAQNSVVKGIKGSRTFLDPSLMRDGMHPTPKGMKKWGDLVVKKVTPILKGFDMKHHRSKKHPEKQIKEGSEDSSTT